MLKGSIFFVLLILILFITPLVSHAESFQGSQSLCDKGHLESCLGLESEKIIAKKDYSYLEYSRKACDLGQDTSCKIFYSSLFYIVLIPLVFGIMLYVSVKFKIKKEDKLYLFSLKYISIVLMFLLLFPTISIVQKIFGWQFGKDVRITAAYVFLMVPLIYVLIVKNSIELKMRLSVKKHWDVLILFITTSSLYSFVSLYLLFHFKDFMPVQNDGMFLNDTTLRFSSVLNSALIIPLFEEFLFKGLLLGLSFKYFKNKKIATLLPLVLFALAHQDLPSILNAGGFAIISFTFASYYNHLIPLIVVHSFFNLLPQIFYRSDYLMSFLENKLQSDAPLYPFWGFCLAVIAVILFYRWMLVLLKKSIHKERYV